MTGKKSCIKSNQKLYASNCDVKIVEIFDFFFSSHF